MFKWIKILLLCFAFATIKCQKIVEESLGVTTPKSAFTGSGDQADLKTFGQECNARYEAFEENWARGQMRLTSFLDDLKLWNCPQFAEECNQPTFAVNNFTTLVYERFCNEENFTTFCAAANDSLDGISDLKRFEVPTTCQQVLMYENSSRNYVEFVLEHIPFCDLVWCGFSSEATQRLDLSAWSCMVSRCQSNVVIIMGVSAGMAFLTVLVNVIVIAVIISYPNSHSRQLIFKLCLAAGDLMCGLVVLPTFIGALYIHFVSPRDITFPSQSVVSNSTLEFNDSDSSYAATASYETTSYDSVTGSPYVRRSTEPEVKEIFPFWYLPFAGTITAWSMMVTLYTLLFASMDHLRSLFKPLSITVNAAIRMARFLSVLAWLVSFVFAILPVFIMSLTPYEVITGLVIARGPNAILFYCLTFLFPLVTTWIFNIFCWIKVKKNNQSADKNKDTESVQVKLITTLTAMTALFTICVLPVGISIVIHVAAHRDGNDALSNREENLRLYAFELIATFILLSKGIWYCILYNIRSKAFRSLTVDRFKAAFFSCCLYDCCRKAQMNARKMRRRVQTRL